MRKANGVCPSESVDGNCKAVIELVTADVAAIIQESARHIHLGYETVAVAVIRQIGAAADWEGSRIILGGLGIPDDVSITIAIYGYAVSRVGAAAADVAAIIQPVALRIDFGDERIRQETPQIV